MLLLGALLALLAAGLWMFAVIDVLLTPGADCRRLSKPAWLAVTSLTLVAGALAWLAFGRPYLPAVRYRRRPMARQLFRTARWARPAGMDAEAAQRRHPAGRARDDWAQGDWTADLLLADLARQSRREPPPPARVAGPDDDPDFLRYLDRVIRDIREAGNEA